MPSASDGDLTQDMDEISLTLKKTKWPSFKTHIKTVDEKVQLLKKVPFLNISTDHDLTSLASHLKFREFTKDSIVNIKEDIIIVLSGSVSFYDRLGVVIKASPYFIFVQGVHPSCDASYYITNEKCTVLFGEKRMALDCLSHNASLLKNLFQYFSDNNENCGFWRIRL